MVDQPCRDSSSDQRFVVRSGYLSPKLKQIADQLRTNLRCLFHHFYTKKVVATPSPITFDRLISFPNIKKCEGIGVLMCKSAMMLVRRLFHSLRSLPDRAKARKEGRDRCHVLDAIVALRFKEHASNVRLERKRVHFFAEFSNASSVTRNSSESRKGAVCVVDRLFRRHINERKVLNITYLERLHGKYDTGEAHPSHLRFGELRPFDEIFLGKQSVTHARCGAPDATCALIATGL